MVKRVGSKGRLGVFEASKFSTPTFANEQPVSLGEELQRREENALHPGEAVLSLIDEMTDFALKFLLTQRSDRSSIDDTPSNSPEGFASRILLASGDVRNRVMNLGPDARSTTKLLHDALELAAAFVQDKSVVERGLLDDETAPQELTQLRMGKIVRDRFPELTEEDQEAVRQHAVAAMNMTQKAKTMAAGGDDPEVKGSTAFVDGVRKFALSVRELDIDLIDGINPFEAAYSVLAKSMNEQMLKRVEAAIAAKRAGIPIEEARDLANRARKFRDERGRLPDIKSPDAWERRMAEGVEILRRHVAMNANG